MALDKDQQSKLRTWTTSARKYGVPKAMPPPTLAGQEDLEAWFQLAEGALQAAANKAREELEATRADAPGHGTDDTSWSRLKTACDKLDTLLLNESVLKTRLKQGRSSLDPRVERLVQEKLEPQLEEVGGGWEATISPEGLRAIAEDLPDWSYSWAKFAYGWADLDMERQIQVLWRSPEGALPVPPPDFEPLEPVRMSSDNLELPPLTQEKEPTSLGALMYRSARTVLYGVLSLSVLFGLRTSSDDDDDGTMTVLMGIVFVVALIYGYGQAQNERAAEKEKMLEDLRKKAQGAVWKAVSHWLSRVEVKLLDEARRQMHDRREQYVTWYRSQVLPAKKRAAQAQSEAKKASDKATGRARELEKRAKLLDGGVRELGLLKQGCGV